VQTLGFSTLQFKPFLIMIFIVIDEILYVSMYKCEIKLYLR